MLDDDHGSNATGPDSRRQATTAYERAGGAHLAPLKHGQGDQSAKHEYSLATRIDIEALAAEMIKP